MTDSKICIISTNHSTFDSRVFDRVAVGLANSGYNVDFFTPHEEETTVKGVHIIPMQEPRNRIHRFLLSIFAFFIVYGEDYDVYHAHDPELLPTCVALRYLEDGEVIFDAHEDFSKAIMYRRWVPSILRPIVGKLVAFTEPRLARHLSAIIVAADDLQDVYDYHPEVVTVANYPELKWTKLDSAGQSDCLQIVYSGGIADRRPVTPFIRGIDMVDEEINIKFIIGGSISDDQKKHIKPLIESSDRTEFVGWLPSREDVLELFAESDIGVVSLTDEHPNETEAAFRSRKVFEYMAAETAVIVPDFGNWPAVVENPKSGVAINVNDPYEIRDCVTELARDRERCNELKQNARSAVIQQYNWESQLENMLELYSELTSSRS